MMMKILAIETSCDETSVAILEIKNGQLKILSNIVSSQIKIHAPFGGVVPSLAKREHQKNLVPVLKQGLLAAKLLKQKTKGNAQKSNKAQNLKLKTISRLLDREPELLKKLLPFLKKYQKPAIDYIAVTNGPGLEPALWVGVNFTKALGYFWNLPIIPINHIEAHIFANWLPDSKKSSLTLTKEEKLLPLGKSQEGFFSDKQFIIKDKLLPAIALIVSGGHTQLILIKKTDQAGQTTREFPFLYTILGETRDDAAGEAFDKLAKMLNLGYPGGPIVAKIAKKLTDNELKQNKTEAAPQSASSRRVSILNQRQSASFDYQAALTLPRPMINSANYDFSFSGLKTAVRYLIKTLSPKQIKKLTPAICAEFQQAVVDVLVKKTIRAAKEFDAKTVLLSGGVAANDLLRESLEGAIYSLNEAKNQTEESKILFSVPAKNYCTDNAAMVGLTAYVKLLPIKDQKSRQQLNDDWQKIQAIGNLRLV